MAMNDGWGGQVFDEGTRPLTDREYNSFVDDETSYWKEEHIQAITQGTREEVRLFGRSLKGVFVA